MFAADVQDEVFPVYVTVILVAFCTHPYLGHTYSVNYARSHGVVDSTCDTDTAARVRFPAMTLRSINEYQHAGVSGLN